MTPHKHAEIIKAWADGVEVEWFEKDVGWLPVSKPMWGEHREYRIKPQLKTIKLHAAIPKAGGAVVFHHGDGNDHSHKGFIRLPHLDCEVEVPE